jgi:hypothetical protein
VVDVIVFRDLPTAPFNAQRLDLRGKEWILRVQRQLRADCLMVE